LIVFVEDFSMLKFELNASEVNIVKQALDSYEAVIARKARSEIDPDISKLHLRNVTAVSDLSRKFVVVPS